MVLLPPVQVLAVLVVQLLSPQVPLAQRLRLLRLVPQVPLLSPPEAQLLVTSRI